MWRDNTSPGIQGCLFMTQYCVTRRQWVKDTILEVLRESGLLKGDGVQPDAPAQQVNDQPAEVSIVSVDPPAEDQRVTLATMQDLGESVDNSNYLGAGLSPKLVARIVNNEFVNMADLLFEGEEQFTLTWDATGSSPKITSTKASRKSPLTLALWSAAFRVFITVYTAKHPTAIAPLMKYYDLVEQMAHDNHNWRAYDEGFRKKRQASPSANPWHRIHHELYVKSVVGRSQAPTPARNQPFRSALPKGFCWMYDRKGKCETKDCKFKHHCAKCSGKHQTQKCSRKKQWTAYAD